MDVPMRHSQLTLDITLPSTAAVTGGLKGDCHFWIYLFQTMGKRYAFHGEIFLPESTYPLHTTCKL